MELYRLRRQARRYLARLPVDDALAIRNAIAALATWGTGDVRKLQATAPPTWRLRIGRFRVLYRREGAMFVIIAIGDRRDIYR